MSKKRGRGSEGGAASPKGKKAKGAAAAPKEGGVALAWGQNVLGQIGFALDTVSERKRPGKVKNLPEDDLAIKTVAGGMHTAVVTQQGKLYTFGCNDEYALGRTCVEADDLPKDEAEAQAALAEGLADVKVVDASAGDSHTFVRTADGKVFGAGCFRDPSGSFAFSDRLFLAKEFVEVWDGEDPAMQLVSGTDHVAILTKSGKVFTYGSSDQGQLGRLAPTYCARDGWRANKKADAEAKLMFGAEYEQKMEEIEKRRTSFPAMHSMLNFNPVTIKKKKGYGSITAIAAGGWSTNAIFESGNVFSWGLNNYGQLGYKTGTKTVEFKPKEATTFGHLKVASISAGQHHTALLTLDGEVHTIGRGDTGQLGIEFAADAKKESAVPVKVNGMEGTITAISTGSTCTFALNADGKAYAWGFGENHQLGTPDDEDRGVPTLLCGQQVDDRRIINIDSGGQHSCATAVDM